MGDAANGGNQNAADRQMLNIPHHIGDYDSSDSSDFSDSDSSDTSDSSSSSDSINFIGQLQSQTISLDGKHRCDTRMIPCSQTWTIEKFDEFLKNSSFYCGQYPKLCSQKFSTPNRWQGLEFRLDIRPRGESFNDREYVALFLSSEGNGRRLINAEMSVIDGNGQKQHTKCCIREDTTNSADYGWYRFVSHKDLKDPRNNLLPNGKLTIHVEVKIVINESFKEPSLRPLLYQEEKSLPDQFESIFESGQFTDVKLVCGRRVIEAHKFILQSRSPVFAAMFENDMQEKNNGKVIIKEVSYETLKLMIRYMYCNKLNESDIRAHSADLYKAADMYQLDSLKKVCEKALCEEVQAKPQLAKQMLAISDLHNSTKLREKTLNVIRKRAIEAVKTLKPEKLADLNDLIGGASKSANQGAESEQKVGRDRPSTSASIASLSGLSRTTSNPMPKRSRLRLVRRT